MRQSLLLIVLVIFSLHAGAQGYDVSGRQINNVITTAVPFLLISPDPIGSGMGECGVATANDMFSLYWNPAKYGATRQLLSSSVEDDFRISVAASPWLRSIVRGIWLESMYASKVVSKNSVVSASLRRFSLGQFSFTNIQGEIVGNYRPVEFAADIALSHKFSENLFGAVAFRYIHSNLTNGLKVGGVYTKPGTSVAADVAFYYETPIDANESTLSFGGCISNIGSKISYRKYSSEKEFIPTLLRIGPSLKLNFDNVHQIRISAEFTKLLVPTPPIYAIDSLGNIMIDDNENPVILKGMSTDVSVLRGMAQSFYDAPDGFREELREITTGIGVEYSIYKVVSFRGGYFNEHLTKGNRKYVTAGLGLKYKFLELQVSRLYAKQPNLMDKTWHFSAGFDLAGIYY